MPPTPPMSTDASFESHSSPSTRSLSQVSVVSAPNYYYETTPPLEADLQRHHSMPAAAIPRVTIPAPAYAQPAYAASSYLSQPALSSYYGSAVQPQAQPHISGMYYQRPLPQVSPVSSPSSVTPQDLTLNRPSLLCPSRSLSHQRRAPTRGSTTITLLPRLRPHSPSRRTATSARPATRPSPAPVP
jgi:hypothetical protein